VAAFSAATIIATGIAAAMPRNQKKMEIHTWQDILS
jgi:hypothetical protein